LLEIIRGLTPRAFERLCQKILYSSGFEDVEVTGRSGDGGIDGKVIFNLNGLLSYRVFFQCKKYASNNTVDPDTVRNLRSPITTEGGNIAKGLINTTSRFTKGAEDEAKRLIP
jgi:restriction system protein